MRGDIASVFGVEVALPPADADPDEVLRAAEEMGAALRGRARAEEAPRAWVALPARSIAAISPDARRVAVERLLAWARERGAAWSGIDFVVAADGGASVRASRAIARGESVLSLPRRLMIVDDALGAGAGHDALAAWLPRAARDPSSPWRAYLDALPAHLPELPMFHSAADLALLAGTAAHEIAAAHAHDVVDRHRALADTASLAELAWGCAIVRSRAFHAPGSIEPKIALLPLVDLFDHALGDLTWSYDPADGQFVVETERDVAAGEPVCFPYGERSNSYLLAHCGFTLADNPLDEADLLLARGADPVGDVAAHLLWGVALAGPARVRVRGTDLSRALSVARLWAADPAERARIGFASNGEVPRLGADNERRAFAAIAAAAERSLAQLGDGPPAADAWSEHCARVRAGERRVLAQIAALAAAGASC